MMLVQGTLCVLLSVAIALFQPALACNEALCASVVSKCMLIKSCDCDMADLKNCTCCRDCHLCLAEHYHHCCSCVDMCPLPKVDEYLKKTSSIADLSDPIPELFNVLTEEVDTLQRWTVHTYPVHQDTLYYSPDSQITIDQKHHFEHSKTDLNGLFNCTVAFMSQCLSIQKCKETCKSMGAARFRWFHDDGCCQCISYTCIDYGLSEAQCVKCPAVDSTETPAVVETLYEDDGIIEAMAYGGASIKALDKRAIEDGDDDL